MKQQRKTQKPSKAPAKAPRLVKRDTAAAAEVIGVAKIAVKGKKKTTSHNPHPGICGQCRLADSCTYPRPDDRPVLECDEFEGYPMRAAAKVSAIKQGKASVKESENIVSLYRGLCSTCEKRENCNFPKPEGGVWHCEEYQ